jgi:hypothetical protein
MSDKPQILVGDEEGRRRRPVQGPPPSAVRDLAPVLVVGGLVLSLTGWIDVLGFYWPPRFGDNDWEFGVIAHTLDVLPLPTLGLVLLALALRAMPERRILARLVALASGLVALMVLGLLLIFALDIPIAFRAVARAAERATASGGQPNPLIHAGVKRVVVKAGVFALGYIAAFGSMAVILWRTPGRKAA